MIKARAAIQNSSMDRHTSGANKAIQAVLVFLFLGHIRLKELPKLAWKFRYCLHFSQDI